MTFTKTPAFLTEAERIQCRDFILTDLENTWTTQMYQRDSFKGFKRTQLMRRMDFPLFWEIQDRIRPLIPGWVQKPNQGSNRIIYHPADTETGKHIDPPNARGHDPLRTNILIQSADAGGEMFVDDIDTELNESDLLIFEPVVTHNVAPITGGVRLLLTFAWDKDT